jgi:lipopolysaccharide biosynthesis regulator YciM
LIGLYERTPSIDLLSAIEMLDPQPALQRQRVAAHLDKHPSLSAARELLRLRIAEHGTGQDPEVKSIEAAIAYAAKPLQRYRCAACGFEAQYYFWQCPGCLNWDSYPTQRLEDL